MNNIERIVLETLEGLNGKSLDNEKERQEIASTVAQVLINQSLNQLAQLTGGELIHDNDGQAIIYTGLRNPQFDRAQMQLIDPFDFESIR